MKIIMIKTLTVSNDYRRKKVLCTDPMWLLSWHAYHRISTPSNLRVVKSSVPDTVTHKVNLIKVKCLVSWDRGHPLNNQSCLRLYSERETNRKCIKRLHFAFYLFSRWQALQTWKIQEKLDNLKTHSFLQIFTSTVVLWRSKE